MVTQFPLPKGAQPPIFGPYLLRPYGCTDQDATWYGGRPRPRRLCVRWGPRTTLPRKGAEPRPIFSSHVYCGQTAGWINMVLGMEVGLSPGDFMLDGPFLLRSNGCMDQDATWYGGRPRPDDTVLDGDPATVPKRGQSLDPSPIFDPCLLWTNGWMDQDGTWARR